MSNLPHGDPPPQVQLPDTAELLRSLASITCPACGHGKLSGSSLCVRCHDTVKHRSAIAAMFLIRIGEPPYTQGMKHAFAVLRVTTFTRPPATSPAA